MTDYKTLKLEELWELFLTERIEIEDKQATRDAKETYTFARHGINIHFDIYDYLEDNMIIKPKSGTVIYKGKTFTTTNLYTELENRKILLKKWINKYVEDDEPLEAK